MSRCSCDGSHPAKRTSTWAGGQGERRGVGAALETPRVEGFACRATMQAAPGRRAPLLGAPRPPHCSACLQPTAPPPPPPPPPSRILGIDAASGSLEKGLGRTPPRARACPATFLPLPSQLISPVSPCPPHRPPLLMDSISYPRPGRSGRQARARPLAGGAGRRRRRERGRELTRPPSAMLVLRLSLL
jgi:hypothetical protein